MFFLIVLFILVPLAELYVIFKIGDAIGWLPTIALLAIDSVLGWWLLKSQGRTVWLRFQETMQSGRVPHREVLDGALVIFGGAFLLTPGFLTDILGFLLLIPPTRAVFRRMLIRRGGRMFGISVATGRRSRPVARQDWDVDGTAVETDQPRLDP
ncbi:MAG TPA: FxsA family protein [Thermoleophilaceae bacterium]|jgi:UPF0716 protein FxsA|nr:FxsA family protein [Thermoleophilaceae bacterium]